METITVLAKQNRIFASSASYDFSPCKNVFLVLPPCLLLSPKSSCGRHLSETPGAAREFSLSGFIVDPHKRPTQPLSFLVFACLSRVLLGYCWESFVPCGGGQSVVATVTHFPPAKRVICKCTRDKWHQVNHL